MSGTTNTKASSKLGTTVLFRKWVAGLAGKLPAIDMKRLLMLNIPYVIVLYLVDKIAWLYRHCAGGSFVAKAGVLFLNFQVAFESPLPSLHGYDLLAGIVGVVAVKLIVHMKGKNAKKYRHGEEYGSAR